MVGGGDEGFPSEPPSEIRRQRQHEIRGGGEGLPPSASPSETKWGVAEAVTMSNPTRRTNWKQRQGRGRQGGEGRGKAEWAWVK